MAEQEKQNLITQKVAAFEQKYSQNSTDYRAALESCSTIDEIKAVSAEQFVKKDDDQNSYEDASNKYSFHQNPDGSYTATGSNGDTIKAQSFEELNDQVLTKMKANSLSENKEPIIAFHSPDLEKMKVFASSAILKHNVTIAAVSSIPTDPEFWKNLKQEYLKDSKHNLDGWVKLTRFISDDILQRDDKEKQLQNDMISADHIRALRQGTNPNLSPKENKQKTSQNKLNLLPNQDDRQY